jgi:uncharacterized phage-associated protein
MSDEDFIQYDSIDVARYLIQRCIDGGITDINNTKINKLLYVIYGLYLAAYDKEILQERPKYFPYGPVFPRVYRNYDNIKTVNLPYGFADNLVKVVDCVIANFANISAGKLSNWSHEEGSPWDKARQKNAGFGDELFVDDIKDYFKNKVLV